MRSKPLALTATLLFLTLLAGLGGVGLSLAGTDRPLPAPATGLDEIAGSYYQGDGLGYNLTLEIDASGTFTYEWRGCLGVYDQGRGLVTRKGDEIVLVTGDKKPPTRLLPLRWGDRRYLLNPEGVMDFVNAINQGVEPREGPHGGPYLHQDDWDLRVSGLPELPPAYAKAILDRPLEGTVLRKVSNTLWEVEVDGEVALGMALFGRREGEADFLCHLEVVSVTAKTAIVEPEVEGTCERLRTGDRVSTRLFEADEAR